MSAISFIARRPPRPAALATFLRLRPGLRSFLVLPTWRIDNLVSTASIVDACFDTASYQSTFLLSSPHRIPSR